MAHVIEAFRSLHEQAGHRSDDSGAGPADPCYSPSDLASLLNKGVSVHWMATGLLDDVNAAGDTSL